ncbi:hypothetical protein GGR51DRAFT_560001 [Nemania sp. FL0031]|nr:hypothetical protein GGR51DRAFT_560001 [Nemania sp. FL0031]
MALAEVIIGIVALLVMSVPGVKWCLKIIRTKSGNTTSILPLSNSPLDAAYMSPCIVSPAPVGMAHQAWAPPRPITSGCQGVVAITISAAVIWPESLAYYLDE